MVRTLPLTVTCAVSETGMTCVVEPSSRSLRVMFPVPARMSSSKVATMLVARETSVALSGGDLRVMTGAVRSCAAVLKVHVASSLIPAKALARDGGVLDRVRADSHGETGAEGQVGGRVDDQILPGDVTWASGRVMTRSDVPEGSPRLRIVIVPPGFNDDILAEGRDQIGAGIHARSTVWNLRDDYWRGEITVEVLRPRVARVVDLGGVEHAAEDRHLVDQAVEGAWCSGLRVVADVEHGGRGGVGRAGRIVTDRRSVEVECRPVRAVHGVGHVLPDPRRDGAVRRLGDRVPCPPFGSRLRKRIRSVPSTLFPIVNASPSVPEFCPPAM